MSYPVRALRILMLLTIVSTLILPAYSLADDKKEIKPNSKPTIWEAPGDISALDLYYGEGGEENAPKGEFKLVKFDTKGSQPKLEVVDDKGVKWRVKIGAEAQPEMVATHLLWAVGYYTDTTFFLPAIRVHGLMKAVEKSSSPMPSDKLIGNDEVFNARMERDNPDEEVIAWKWSWFDNPFVGTREFNGLKVMMALINNWDLKDINNKISRSKSTGKYHYMINDLGASFGKTGGVGSRSKGNLSDYAESRFIKEFKGDKVDFYFDSRPPMIMFLNASYYAERTKMTKIVEGIPRADAKWIGGLLSQLTDDQLSDAFRAAGYKPGEVREYVDALRERINELNDL